MTRIEPEARELVGRWISEGLVRNTRELAGMVRAAMRACAGDLLREADLRAVAPGPPHARGAANEPGTLEAILQDGAIRAKAVTSQTMADMRRAMQQA